MNRFMRLKNSYINIDDISAIISDSGRYTIYQKGCDEPLTSISDKELKLLLNNLEITKEERIK